MDRPITTLFMLMSVDGKSSTGAADEPDVDRDFPKIPGVREGLHPYYEIEQTTDLWSFHTGRVQTKMGVNGKKMPAKTPALDRRHMTPAPIIIFRPLVLHGSNQKTARNWAVLVYINPIFPISCVQGEKSGSTNRAKYGCGGRVCA